MLIQEAIALENKLQEKLSNSDLGNSTISLGFNLRNHLKINIDDKIITFDVNGNEVIYISGSWEYYDLLDDIKRLELCVEENREDFELLLWSYKHKSELKEGF